MQVVKLMRTLLTASSDRAISVGCIAQLIDMAADFAFVPAPLDPKKQRVASSAVVPAFPALAWQNCAAGLSTPSTLCESIIAMLVQRPLKSSLWLACLQALRQSSPHQMLQVVAPSRSVALGFPMRPAHYILTQRRDQQAQCRRRSARGKGRPSWISRGSFVIRRST